MSYFILNLQVFYTQIGVCQCRSDSAAVCLYGIMSTKSFINLFT